MKVVEDYNKLSDETTERLLNASKTFVPLYTAIGSGLIFLSLSLELSTILERWIYFSLILSSLALVAIFTFMDYLYFLISYEKGKTFADHINKNGPKGYNLQIGGKKWHNTTFKILIKTIIPLLLVNVTLLGCFSFSLIF